MAPRRRRRAAAALAVLCRCRTASSILRGGGRASFVPPRRPQSGSEARPGATSPLTLAGDANVNEKTRERSQREEDRHSILDDGRGHINGEFHGGDPGSKGYSDLVQEGMTALLRAMKSYENHARYAASAAPFADHAERTVRDALLHHLAESSHGPVRLPARMEAVLRRADEAAERLRGERAGTEWRDNDGELGGREDGPEQQRRAEASRVSLSDVAAEIGVEPRTLASYRAAARRADAAFVDGAVSVEGGVEVYDPALAGVIRGVGTKLRPRGDVEGGVVAAGAAGEGGAAGADDPLSSAAAPASPANGDELGDDGYADGLDDWDAPNPDRTVTSLRDALPDTDVRNNPLPAAALEAGSDVLDVLLDGCLDTTECEVIRLRFGLERSRHGGRGWTAAEIAEATGMGTDEVRDVAAGALDKLREAAREMAEYEYDPLVEVSL